MSKFSRRYRIEAAKLVYVRKTLAALQGWRCFYCERSLDAYTVTYDHLVTRGNGGEVSLDNGVAACRHCNNDRKDAPFLLYCERVGVPVKDWRGVAKRMRALKKKAAQLDT